MKQNAYAVFDSKAAHYNSPWFMHNDQMAIRAFADIANDNKTVIGAHPEDYTLYNIGEYDNITAKYTGRTPIAVANASSCIKIKPLAPMPHDTPLGKSMSIHKQTQFSNSATLNNQFKNSENEKGEIERDGKSYILKKTNQ